MKFEISLLGRYNTKSLEIKHRAYNSLCMYSIAGGFVTTSNLLASQTQQSTAMLEALDKEQKEFYGKRIKTLTDYLGLASQNTSYDSLRDENIIETFIKALLDENLKEIYKVESGRYRLYYNLLKLPKPENIQQWLLKKFLNFPGEQ